MEKRKGLLAGSFDPITKGHRDLAFRALELVDHLTIAVGINAEKHPMFSLEEKILQIKKTIGDNNLPITITSYEGSLVDFVYKSDFNVVFRGGRNSKDYEAEQELYQSCQSQNIPVEFVFLPARKEYLNISSSSIKAWQASGGFIHDFVHPYTKQCIEARMSGQYIVGITGVMGSGKSLVAKELTKLGKDAKIPTYHIDMDQLAHQILSGEYLGEINPYLKVRKEIIETFYERSLGKGPIVKDWDSPKGKEALEIDRKILSKIVFEDPQALKELNDIMKVPVEVAYREVLKNKRGLIFVNAPLLLEGGWNFCCNNNVIVVSVNNEDQFKRLKEDRVDRGLFPIEELKTRINSQWTTEEKISKLKGIIDSTGHGKMFIVKNNYTTDLFDGLKNLFEEVLNYIDIYGELRYTLAWNKMGLNGTPTESYKKLVAQYNQPHRHYHTLSHIMSGVNDWSKVVVERTSIFNKNPWKVLFAWFYHDYIMEPLSKVDEIRSALYAKDLFKGEELESGQPSFEDIPYLIVSGTSHKKISTARRSLFDMRSILPTSPELTIAAKYMSDWDLKILSLDPYSYREYSDNIRKEYYYVEDKEYAEGRIAVLEKFMNAAKEKNLYYYLGEEATSKAFLNLRTEIESLKSKLKKG